MFLGHRPGSAVVVVGVEARLCSKIIRLLSEASNFYEMCGYAGLNRY